MRGGSEIKRETRGDGFPASILIHVFYRMIRSPPATPMHNVASLILRFRGRAAPESHKSPKNSHRRAPAPSVNVNYRLISAARRVIRINKNIYTEAACTRTLN